MSIISSLSLDSANGKRGTIWVRCSFCHVQDSRTCMLQEEFFILKFLTTDGLATSVVVVPWLWTIKSFCEGRKLCIQIFSSQCSEHGSFLLSLEFCLPRGQRYTAKGLAISNHVTKKNKWFDHDFNISKSVDTFLMSPCEIEIMLKLQNEILDNRLFIKASVNEKLHILIFYLNNFL